ncbi:hypothetical protein C4D60_Mb10t11770 [Musa balbisiana]|uniref:Uncharacterized protein n=1 Tax=Musa balbisiana TaxID=52838 RepID=A0A4S8IWE1_MUSBA|nr:hypothetical protein C4D60_Mb10t11770 [Musa balbisiana]
MAKPSVSLQNIKDFWNSQVNDEANWAVTRLQVVWLRGGGGVTEERREAGSGLPERERVIPTTSLSA